MTKNFEKIASLLIAEDLESNVNGIKSASKVIDEFTDLTLNTLKNRHAERLIIVENMSLYFSNFFNKLNFLLNANDEDMSFWSASLIVHFQIFNDTAISILAKHVREGKSEKLFVACNILFRTRYSNLKKLIQERLTVEVTKDEKAFLEEKLILLKENEK